MHATQGARKRLLIHCHSQMPCTSTLYNHTIPSWNGMIIYTVNEPAWAIKPCCRMRVCMSYVSWALKRTHLCATLNKAESYQCEEDRPSSTIMLPLASDVSVHVGHGYASKLTLASKNTDVGWSGTFNTASCVMLSEQSDWLVDTPARRLQSTVACTGICATGSGDRPELVSAQTVQA